MKTKLILSIIITVAISTVLQAQSYGSFTDTRDGKTYKTVQIGEQIWMAENLNFSPNSGSWCYRNEDLLCDTYGRLYTWEVAKYVCPRGWHLPSEAEFKTLLSNVGGSGFSWEMPSKAEFETLLSNVGGSGSNVYNALKDGGSSGFNALFGGWRGSQGDFYCVGYGGSWWSSSESGTYNAWSLYMLGYNRGASMYDGGSKELGFSVRCKKE